MDKYKQYVDVHWWNGIGKRDIDNWVKNFGSNREMAEWILDNVIFYNSAQLKAYTRFLINELKKEVYMCAMKEGQYSYMADEKLEVKWNEYVKQTIFMPAAVRGDTASSAYKIIGYWRNTLKRGGTPISDIVDIGQEYERGIRRFILVDDFSGSGKQMGRVLAQKVRFGDREVELGKLAGIIDDIEIIIAVYVIHEKALKEIKDVYSGIKVMYVDYLGEDLNYLNEDALMFETVTSDKRRDIIEEIKRIHRSIVEGNAQLENLSGYVLNIPVVFEHGCPNNTLLLLFAQSENWQQLFKRGDEV